MDHLPPLLGGIGPPMTTPLILPQPGAELTSVRVAPDTLIKPGGLGPDEVTAAVGARPAEGLQRGVHLGVGGDVTQQAQEGRHQP
jgi:hypothetical protein